MTAHRPEERLRARAEAASRKVQMPAPGARYASAPRGGGPSSAEVVALQRTLGNRAVSRLLEDDQHAHDEESSVQRSSVQEVLGTSGTPLAAPVRTEMEARLGADFSDVRLHTGPSAQRSAAEIGARAYTSGSHVVIGDGGADRHTLAHELTHVIQQRQGPVSGTDNGGGLRVSDPSDRFEREAEANATRVMQRSPAAQVQRTPATPAARLQGANVQRVHYSAGEAVTAHPGFTVTLRATLNGHRIGTFSSETTPYSPGDHAEDQMVDEIEATIANLQPNRAVQRALADIQGRRHILEIDLTASPCSSRRGTAAKADRAEGCAERLIELAEHGYLGHHFKIYLNAHHLYRPGGVSDSKRKSEKAMQDMAHSGIRASIG
jgi:hypothetical protein